MINTMEKPVQLERLAPRHYAWLELAPELLQMAQQPGAHFSAIYDCHDCVGLVGVRAVGDTAELFVFINPPKSGRGYGTGAARAMTCKTFCELGYTRIYADCLKGRAASRIMQKLGFVGTPKTENEMRYVLSKEGWVFEDAHED